MRAAGRQGGAVSTISWTIEEEKLVKEMVETEGMRNWETIATNLAQKIGGNIRLGKQCRQRYMNFIKFGGDRKKLLRWTPQQKEKLFNLYKENGSKWVMIAQQFSNKSQNCVKNQFYGCIRKLVRGLNKVLDENRKSHKNLRYQSLIKVLEFSEILFNEKFSNKMCLPQLKEMIIRTAQKIQEMTSEEIMAVIKEVNRFNLLTRSSRGKRSKPRIKKLGRVRLIMREQQINENNFNNTQDNNNGMKPETIEEQIVKIEEIEEDRVKIQEISQDAKPRRFIRNSQ